jgi:hypothetical protein
MSRAPLRRFCDGALIVVVAIASLIGAAWFSLQPRDPAAGVAVVFAPWVAADQTFVRAVTPGARFVRYGGLPFIAVVVPDSTDYERRVLATGAIMVADPRAMAACLSPFGLDTRS